MPPRSRTADLSHDTRSRLIREAARLFQMRGYHGVGVAEILGAARAPKGSLYHHFPEGKGQLAIAVIQHLESEVSHRLSKCRKDGRDVGSTLVNIAAEIAAWFDATGHAQGSIFASLAVGLSPEDRAIADALREALKRLERRLAELFISAGIDKPNIAAQELLVFAEGAMLHAKVQRDGSFIEDAITRFVARNFQQTS